MPAACVSAPGLDHDRRGGHIIPFSEINGLKGSRRRRWGSLFDQHSHGALDGVKYYTLHLARAAMTAFLEKNVSPRAASVTLAHALEDKEQSGMSDVTREYYSVDQLMEEKAIAMKAWSDALIEAFLDGGGTLPASSAQQRKPKAKLRP